MGRFAQACAMGCVLLAAFAASAQAPRPDAGTLQEQPRTLPALPAPGGPRIAVPPVSAPPATPASTVTFTPAGFAFTGNTLYPGETLLPLVAARIGQPTTLAGLQEAARAVRGFYQDRGFLLTDALIPEQALPREGGIVTIHVVEARIGEVTVRLEGAAAAHAERLVRQALPAGAHASEYALDRAVLVARDLPGHDATATVQPGARSGAVDVVVTVRGERRHDFSLGLDNHGVRSAGEGRAFADFEAANATGRGDSFNARVQISEITDTRLYRLAYSLPVGALGSRATFALARSEYALGKSFAALGASGHADIASVSLLHPLVRSRLHNLYGVASLERKAMSDELAATPGSMRHLLVARVGLAGNGFDQALGGSAFSSGAVTVAGGRLRMDGASSAADSGPGGLGAAGGFGKANAEFQRTQFFAPRLSAHGALQTQWAFNNLSSAEKMAIGGPAGVRAYPAGEAVGDSGTLFNLELRYQFEAAAWPLAAALFYDTGRVRASRDPVQAAGNRRSLSGAGLSLQAGTAGRFVAGASLAWRVGGEPPSGGEPDRSPRFWFTSQLWF